MQASTHTLTASARQAYPQMIVVLIATLKAMSIVVVTVTVIVIGIPTETVIVIAVAEGTTATIVEVGTVIETTLTWMSPWVFYRRFAEHIELES